MDIPGVELEMAFVPAVVKHNLTTVTRLAVLDCIREFLSVHRQKPGVLQRGQDFQEMEK